MMIVDDDSLSCPCIMNNHLASLSTFYYYYYYFIYLFLQVSPKTFLMLVGLVFVIGKFKEDNLRDGRISEYENSSSNCFNK